MTVGIEMSPPAGALSVLADPGLVGLAAAGNDAAFEALDRRHRPAVLRQCGCLLRSPHDAEEATQQAMFKAYRALATGVAPASFLPWVLTIARNECFDMMRARKGVESLSVDVAAGGETLPEHVERRERVATLKEDLVELPDAQRRALVLRGVGDLSHAEIARILGGTPMEMRTLVHEARSSLAEFEAGRELDCAVVRERIDTGDGRALRARRVRAHLRACEPCSLAVGRVRDGRRRLASFLPFPIFGAVRAALFGGGSAGVAGPAGVVGVSAAVVAAAVIGLGGGGTGGGSVAMDRATGSAQAAAMARGVVPPTATATTTGSPRAGAGTRSGSAGSAPSTGSAAPAAPAAPGGEGQAAAPAATTPVRTPPVTTPGRGTPAVTVPPVTVPSVTVPPVTVASVTVPPVTTPALPVVGSLTTPQISTPPVTTPVVATPPVSTPVVVVPPVTVPPVSVLP